MSSEAVGYVFRHSPYKGATLAVHHAIADSANDQHHNEFWMISDKLAKKARLNRATVRTCLSQLVKDGFLKVVSTTHGGRGLATRYRFMFPKRPVAFDSREPETVAVDDSIVQTETVAVDAETVALDDETVAVDAETVAVDDTLIKATQENPTNPREPKGEIATKTSLPDISLARPPTTETWEAYRLAFLRRYQTQPVRNAKVNGQLAQVVKRLGAEEAPQVAAFFVSHNDAYYVRRAHQVDCLLADAEKLRTEWATGRKVNAKTARDQENLEGNGAFQLLAERKRRAGTDR